MTVHGYPWFSFSEYRILVSDEFVKTKSHHRPHHRLSLYLQSLVQRSRDGSDSYQGNASDYRIHQEIQTAIYREHFSGGQVSVKPSWPCAIMG
jgi:hypothetical protein